MATHAPDALKERIGTLSLDKQEKIEADAAKAERKAEKKAETEAKKKAVSNGDNGGAVSLVDAHGRLAGVENHSGCKGMYVMAQVPTESPANAGITLPLQITIK